MKFDDRDRSTELTKEESPAAAAKQRRGNQEPKGEAGKDSLELQCSVCDRKYPMEKHRAFKQHVKKHERSVQCETCGKWLSCSDSLKHHQVSLFALLGIFLWPFSLFIFFSSVFHRLPQLHPIPPLPPPSPCALASLLFDWHRVKKSLFKT